MKSKQNPSPLETASKVTEGARILVQPEAQVITTDLASPTVFFQAKPSQDWESFLGEQ